MQPKSIIQVARKLIDTPYQHQGRIAQVGIDCIGVIIFVGNTLELFDYDNTNYSREPDGTLITELDQYCQKLSKPTTGAIAVFNIFGTPHHTAIISDFRGNLGLIHAYQNVGKVREHEFIPWWQEKLHSVYGFPGVNYG